MHIKTEVIQPFSHLAKKHLLSTYCILSSVLWEKPRNCKSLLRSSHKYSGKRGTGTQHMENESQYKAMHRQVGAEALDGPVI